MCCVIARVLFCCLVTAGLTLNLPDTADADPHCQVTDPLTGECTITVEAPSTPSAHNDPGGAGPKDTGSGASCYWDPAKQGLSRPPAGPVACRSGAGYWSNAYNCYIKALRPQPPADDPAWKGHEPGEGAVYSCYQPQTGIDIMLWAQDPPAGSGGGPSPREVAEIAVDTMHLSAIEIGIVPKQGPDSVGLVGMPVWMWVQDPDAHTFGPTSASASAGGITVTAKARVQQITWDMGDGSTVVCRTEGTPYQPSFGKRQSPSCGHVYEKSSAHESTGRYTVTATSDWVVTWSGAGQSGTIRLDGLSRSAEIAVGEAQVLVQ